MLIGILVAIATVAIASTDEPVKQTDAVVRPVVKAPEIQPERHLCIVAADCYPNTLTIEPASPVPVPAQKPPVKTTTKRNTSS